jgi:demethylmenaquinone methyltransferase/2-methoxy-6-polyprenyl-1,4-benzoquinol methylase
MRVAQNENTDELMTDPGDTVAARSLMKYRKHAAGYDSTCGPTWSIRERTIDALQLQPGQRVLDVGCGTGLSLSLLLAGVGATGRIYGIDQSPDMLAFARHRADEQGWDNVRLMETAAQHLSLPEPVDALLFHYTHDVLRSPAAVSRLLACARPQARVAIAGIKYFPGWLAPLNPWVYFKNYGYNGAPGELGSPWDRIAPFLEDWRMTPTQFGMGYIGVGRVAIPHVAKV